MGFKTGNRVVGASSARLEILLMVGSARNPADVLTSGQGISQSGPQVLETPEKEPLSLRVQRFIILGCLRFLY